MTTRVGRARHPYGYYTGGQWAREHHLINIFFFFFLSTCVVVVIATAGAEASHRQGGQTWTFTASIDGADSDAAPNLTDKQDFGVKGSAEVTPLRKSMVHN